MKMQASLVCPRFRGKLYGTDKILVERVLGLQITRIGEGHITQKRVVVSVWRGKSRSACRYHATAEIILQDGRICAGSRSAMSGETSEWVEGAAIFAAFADAGVQLEWEDAVGSEAITRGHMHAAIKAVGQDIFGLDLAIIE